MLEASECRYGDLARFLLPSCKSRGDVRNLGASPPAALLCSGVPATIGTFPFSFQREPIDAAGGRGQHPSRISLFPPTLRSPTVAAASPLDDTACRDTPPTDTGDGQREPGRADGFGGAPADQSSPAAPGAGGGAAAAADSLQGKPPATLPLPQRFLHSLDTCPRASLSLPKNAQHYWHEDPMYGCQIGTQCLFCMQNRTK
jgi:hypothetical protein